ncbi:hypothetical protein Patl1_30229 [Pistacia atlantica]|nr:hypothetical protein Patl1_30229 [Pistacia atlantica]
MGDTVYEDLLLKSFFAEVSEVERDNEVLRILSCFKLNPFEYLNLPFDATPDDIKKQYRKLSLLVHPDKCKHPQAKEAFAGKQIHSSYLSWLQRIKISYLASHFYYIAFLWHLYNPIQRLLNTKSSVYKGTGYPLIFPVLMLFDQTV